MPMVHLRLRNKIPVCHFEYSSLLDFISIERSYTKILFLYAFYLRHNLPRFQMELTIHELVRTPVLVNCNIDLIVTYTSVCIYTINILALLQITPRKFELWGK